MEQKVIFITGTNSGFGKLALFELAKKGYFVIGTVRDESKKDALLEEARSESIDHNIDIFILDVTNEAQVISVVQQVISKYENIDVLIHNAGFSQGGLIEVTSVDDWVHQFDTNLLGVVRLTKAVLPHMRKRRKGKIINVGSISGRIGLPGMGPYAASKFALEGFSESLSLEMAPFHVHVSLIEAGSFKTNIWDKGIQNVKATKEKDYEQLMETLFVEAKKTSDSAGNPLDVVDVILKICKAKTPKFRYQVGKGVRFVIFLKAVLPWTWISKVITSKFK
ncbi:SDR family oxidoreductase [Bacillus shivajii]|uniref:SDR family oxidoreductase n=1 Tax=Bacillus shivajii TaxID=1983719 RepID=UPI001CFBCE41|nr:SDR family oxidoreductase [Bacillus shivajii]UCZ51395.1 SDR family oxidoreductase [Bacillus shivajii]